MKLETKYFIEQSRTLVAKDNVRKAIKMLRVLADSFELEDTRKELAHIASNFDELEVYIMADTIDKSFAAMQKSRMKQRLLIMADELESSLRGKKLDVEIRFTEPVEKEVSDRIKEFFA